MVALSDLWPLPSFLCFDLLFPCSDYDKDESGAISAAEMRNFLNGEGEVRAAKTVDITGWIEPDHCFMGHHRTPIPHILPFYLSVKALDIAGQ